jgi:hypothetical protein
MTGTANEIPTGISWTEGAVEVDAWLVARGLKLPAEELMAEMRRGIVYSTSEHGIGEDEGRCRLTFRYRDRVFQLIVTKTGEVVSEDSSRSEGLTISGMSACGRGTDSVPLTQIPRMTK